LCKKICDENSWVKLITFTRNFGYQPSILCGLKQYQSDFYTIVDVDLQDPPGMIVEFLKINNEEGFQVVFGNRADRDENFLIKNLRKLYYKIMKIVADQDFQIDMAEFFLITDEVKKNIINNKNTNIFLRNEVAFTGYKRKGIKFIRQKRIAGKGVGESFLYMIVYGFSGLLATSTLPLRISFYAFCPIALINFLTFFEFEIIPSVILNTLNMLFIGYTLSFISIYLARIHKDIVGRPLYIIDYQKSVL
jgi:dolichol-phosphate mannosyltransferase